MNDSKRNAETKQSKRTVQRRPIWICLFAAILILTAGVGSAQEAEQGQPALTIVQYDGIEKALPKAKQDPRMAADAAAARRKRIRDLRSGRPRSAAVQATLANFDSDSNPDGWRVEVMLLDANDRPVSKRAHAAFELMPRLPSADYVGYVNTQASPERWSMPLKFDDDGVARVKLRLSQKLKSVFDRHVTFLPDPGLGISVNQSRQVVLRRSYGNSLTDSRQDWRYNLGRPEFGQLKARISVPTEGVFEAVTAVPIRPSVLVDTNWPYR